MEGPSLDERVRVCKIHFLKSLEWKGDRLGVFEMRRHYAGYFKGMQHSKEWRTTLVSLIQPNEIIAFLDSIPERALLTAADF